jgi:hypothetical protein
LPVTPGLAIDGLTGAELVTANRQLIQGSGLVPAMPPD